MKIYRFLFLAVLAFLVLISPRIILAADDSNGGEMYDNGSMKGNAQKAPPLSKYPPLLSGRLNPEPLVRQEPGGIVAPSLGRGGFLHPFRGYG